MFGYENKTSYCIDTSKQPFENHVDLLLIWNGKKSHHILIEHFGTFMT